MQSTSRAAIYVLLLVGMVTSQPLEGQETGHQKHRVKRIINGDVAAHGAHPYIVSLQKDYPTMCAIDPTLGRCSRNPTKDDFFHFCGGVLISESWVLTAAHCVENIEEKFIPAINIVLGEQHLYENSCNEVYRKAAAVIMHEGYIPEPFLHNDIALIKLSQPVAEGNHVQFAFLSENEEKLLVNTECVVAGWGQGSGPELNEVKQTLLSFEDCVNKTRNDIAKALQELRETYPKINNPKLLKLYIRTLLYLAEIGVNADHLIDSQVCTEDEMPRPSGFCYGDSGGPLVCGDDLLVGLVSYGDPTPDCEGKIPHVYTRVSAYRDWIKENTQNYDQNRGNITHTSG